MASQAQEDLGVKVKSLRDIEKEFNLTIPKTGSIRIKPFLNSVGADQKAKSRTWGTVRRSGWFRIESGIGYDKVVCHVKEWNYMGRSLELHGSGMLLNMENPSHQNLYAIFMFSEQWKGVVVENKGRKSHHSRFHIFNPEAEATAYLKSVEVQDEMIDMIRELNDTQLPLFGLMFNIKGSNSVIKATLRQMTAKPEQCKKIGEIMLSPDREYMETIAVAESKANPNAPDASNRGLYKKHTGIYYWGDTSLGVGIAGCTAYLKANPDLYLAIRQLYFGEKAGEQKLISASNETPEEKVFREQVDAIVNAYNSGTKDVKLIGQMVNCHWKRIEKILKENKDRLKD